MNNAIVNFPVPANEPVKPYLEDSPERIALDAELKRQFNTVVDIPIIIGGKEIRTGNIGKGSIHVAEDGDKYVNGLFLLKDDWERPASCSFRPGTSADFSTNIYTTGDSPEDFDGSWQEMEAAGAVFLPAAGGRGGVYINGVGSYGNCWSSSEYDSNYAYYLIFYSGEVSIGYFSSRYLGHSVRLAHD